MELRKRERRVWVLQIDRAYGPSESGHLVFQTVFWTCDKRQVSELPEPSGFDRIDVVQTTSTPMRTKPCFSLTGMVAFAFWLLLVVVASPAQSSAAEQTQYHSRNWQMDSGLP